MKKYTLINNLLRNRTNTRATLRTRIQAIEFNYEVLKEEKEKLGRSKRQKGRRRKKLMN